MGERKLATVRSIDEIRPIKGADLIELAVVGGWHSVVKKGEFGVGDEIIYCEIDSWIPQTIAPFLCKGEEVREYEGVKGERLRTVKLRGQLSQGLILPISVIDQASLGRCLSVGEDVSEILGIIKYEPPIPAQLAGDVVGLFPSFIFKTDEERCLSEETVLITEDGEKTIAEICRTKYSGKVLSHNFITKSDEFNFLNSHSIQPNNEDWYEIELESGEILKATGNHKVWLPASEEYVEVRTLLEGDFLWTTEK